MVIDSYFESVSSPIRPFPWNLRGSFSVLDGYLNVAHYLSSATVQAGVKVSELWHDYDCVQAAHLLPRHRMAPARSRGYLTPDIFSCFYGCQMVQLFIQNLITTMDAWSSTKIYLEHKTYELILDPRCHQTIWNNCGSKNSCKFVCLGGNFVLAALL